MADGNIIIHGRVIAGLEASGMSLEDADGAGHVVTRCPHCDHRESTDTSWWRMSHWDRQASLGTLSRRLRCLCGHRDVTLEVWPVVPCLDEETPRTFHWRA
jgi:hypothetical protein